MLRVISRQQELRPRTRATRGLRGRGLNEPARAHRATTAFPSRARSQRASVGTPTRPHADAVLKAQLPT